MKILSPARSQAVRCLRCGNSFSPQELDAPLVTCPVVGCGFIFDPQQPPLTLPDPQAGSPASTLPPQGPDAPLPQP